MDDISLDFILGCSEKHCRKDTKECCEKCYEVILVTQTSSSVIEEMRVRIGMLRQWLNEDRIDDPKKMVNNEDIEHWLDLKTLLKQKIN